MTAMIACLVAAAVWRALHRARATARRAIAAQRELAELVEFTAAAVAAGLSPMAALVLHADITDGAAGSRHAALAWRDGHGTTASLGHIETRCGAAARGYCEAMAAALSDGQPLADTLSRLTHEARSARARAADESVARLPVRLAVPLVACVLPSYVLLGAVPVMAFAREAFA